MSSERRLVPRLRPLACQEGWLAGGAARRHRATVGYEPALAQDREEAQRAPGTPRPSLNRLSVG